ncbi:response regulator transcription factor [Bradyrhizobium sp. RDI18]|uniref:response regulator transcription factor n=1 Tax=Bradyrhizobium sp. RDI18 TaxID=3367400 RepID=UPI003713931C
MAEASPWIAIVDDDPAVLKALSRLLRSHAFRARAYGSGAEFLAALPAGLPVCLIVDLQMPEMNGLELQQHLISNGIKIPTILISAHGDATLCTRSDDGTLVASLRKPLQEETLFSAIDRAIGSSGNAS